MTDFSDNTTYPIVVPPTNGYLVGCDSLYNPKKLRISDFLAKDSNGNVSFGDPTSAGGIRYVDFVNGENTNGASAVDMRLITRNVAGSGLVTVDMTKYKNGEFVIANTETDTAANIKFSIGGTERARIDSLGRVAIGSALGGPICALDIQRPGTSTAQIYLRNATHSLTAWVDASNALLGTVTNTALYFFTNNITRFVMTAAGIAPAQDNVYAFGSAGFRGTTAYFTTGTINTSDERAKKWLGRLKEAHRCAARRIKAEIGLYQWNEELERKGDGARVHIGIRAQQVIRIMMEEGLEAQQNIDLPGDLFIPEGERPSFKHAFLCFDTWEEQREPVTELRMVERIVEGEEMVASKVLDASGRPVLTPRKTRTKVEVEEIVESGETRVTLAAGNRFGIRADQLALFLAAFAAE